MIVISDTTPIISLLKAGKLELLENDIRLLAYAGQESFF